MIGALKAKFGGYTVPMLFMTCVNSLAVVYFAILLPFLPAKTSKAQAVGAQTDACSPLNGHHPSATSEILHILLSNVLKHRCYRRSDTSELQLCDRQLSDMNAGPCCSALSLPSRW